jgi:hypothetical protein
MKPWCARATRDDKPRSPINANRANANRSGAIRGDSTPPTATRSGAARRNGLQLALATACISGVAVLLNSYGIKAFGDPTTYTTAKNVVAALVLVGLIAALFASRHGAVLTRPSRPGQWAGLAVVGVFGEAIAFVLFFEGWPSRHRWTPDSCTRPCWSGWPCWRFHFWRSGSAPCKLPPSRSWCSGRSGWPGVSRQFSAGAS